MAKTMDEMEQQLVQAWKEVFELDEVKDDDNFFELGGDSIKAVQLVAWLLQKGIKLDLMDVFANPTIEEMVPILEETAPMYIPPSIINKDQLAAQQGGAAPAPAPAPAPVAPAQDQLCTGAAPAAPAQDQLCTGAAPAQGQLCTPQQAPGQQLCTPQAPQGQLCTPQAQLCTPQAQQMATGALQQLCTPQGQQLVMGVLQQLCTPQGQQLVTGTLQQLCTPQGQQMVNGALQQLCTPQGQQMVNGAMQQLCTGGPGAPPVPGRRPAGVVDKPIDKPNVMQMEKPHVKVPTTTPEVALETVLRGILNKPFDKDADLFKIGISNFGIMQIITRCAEQGYSVTMKDISQNHTFNTLVKKLVPGDGK